MHLTPLQWFVGGLAALLIGLSKTGVPGVGILVIPLMAFVFGGRLSVGATLLLLSFADIFAVVRYRSHARWDRVIALAPWVLMGLFLGAVVLNKLGQQKNSTKDILSIVIGVMVLMMLAVHFARKRWGEALTPHSKGATISTGVAAGFSTMVSNAAGPIMTIYLAGMGMDKNQFMGTNAWYFFIFNLVKIPILLYLTFLQPGKPLVSIETLSFNAAVAPIVAIGALTGSWLLPRIPQKQFDSIVLALAGLAAAHLILTSLT